MPAVHMKWDLSTVYIAVLLKQSQGQSNKATDECITLTTHVWLPNISTLPEKMCIRQTVTLFSWKWPELMGKIFSMHLQSDQNGVIGNFTETDMIF